MRTSKAFHFLSLLTPKELERFHQYVSSPFFNKNEDLTRLLEVYQRLIPLKNKNISESEAFILLYPGRKESLNKLRKLKSALLDLLLSFFAYLDWERPTGSHFPHLLSELNHRQENQFIPHYFKEGIKALETRKERDSAYYRDLFLLESEYNRFILAQPKRSSENRLEVIFDSLDSSYLMEKLLFAFSARERERILGEKHDLRWIDTLLKSFLEGKKELPPQAEIFARMYKLSVDPEDEENYRLFRELLEKHSDLFLYEDRLDMYTSALNFCQRKASRGEPGYLEELFSLYKTMLKEGIVLEEGLLSVLHFKNIVTIASRLSEFEWTRYFIDGFRNRLIAGPHKIAIDFAEGTLAFFQSEYAEAERWFNLVLDDFEDIFFGLDARRFQLRVYYETHNTIGMESLCNSFRVLLTRTKKISPQAKALYQSFVKFFRRLINTPPEHRKRLTKLRDDIQSGQTLEGAWLIEKIDQLLGIEA